MIESWRRSVRGSEAFESVHRLRRHADGMFRWHLSRGVAMRDASGAVVGWVGTNTDIHDIYEARQVQALERVVMSPAFESVLGRLSGTYREILAYQKDNVVARFPDGEPVSEAPALQLVELDILRLVAQGYSNREIARTLNYSVGAIKGHIREILDKLEAVDRTAAAVRAVRFGLI
jgi:DNA-binding NarL/FixJ family response regulator